MSYGRFSTDGKIYIVNTAKTPTTWYNYVFNDEYYMELSQTLQGKSFIVERYDPQVYITGYRHFYILLRNSGEVFCPLGVPLKTKLDSFECRYRLGSSSVVSEFKGVKTTITAMVPTEGTKELWSLEIENCTGKTEDISLFSAFPFENTGPMGGECRFIKREGVMYKHSFPYHVFYDDKENVENKKAYYYLICDNKIHSYDGNSQRFYGGGDITDIPAALQRGECSNINCEGEESVGAVENRFHLNPGEKKQINIVLGAASSLNEAIKNKRFNLQEEFKKVERLWDERCGSFIINTPNAELNYFANYWLKKQAIFLTRLNRTSTYCPVRNQLQDALGYSLIEPYQALEYALKVLRRQHANGYLKQWYMTDGSPDKALCLLNHSDAPIWLIFCLVEIIEKCGDKQMYGRLEGYMDSNVKEPILTHLLKAAYYMSRQTGQHGLCLMLDGDWTDPVNGVGRLEKGESTWNTMALIYCLNKLIPLVERDEKQKLEAVGQALTNSLNQHAWDGNWYVAGFDDSGRPFGTHADDEGKIFLNAQSWAVISGVAKGDRLKKVVESINSLDTSCGPLLLYPAFSKWNKVWGRISIKQAGTTENGAIYCHASMFKALADVVSGNGDAALNTILKTLPTNPQNPPEVNNQLPLFVSNYYFGLKNENFGRSSCNYGTGTTGWLLWVLIEHILGIKATTDGLKVQPMMPKAWKHVEVVRVYKGKTYKTVINNGAAAIN